MVELNTLYEDLRNQQIALYTYDVDKGVTIELNNRYAIFIDPFKIKSVQEIKHILAHEIGHCATGCTHKVSSKLDIVQRHEYKANRWAIERYLPWNDLKVAIEQGYEEPWQLAEYFDMPEKFIRQAITHYINIKGYAVKYPRR